MPLLPAPTPAGSQSPWEPSSPQSCFLGCCFGRENDSLCTHSCPALPQTVSAVSVVFFPRLLHTFPVWRIFHIASPSQSREQPQVPPSLLLPLPCLDIASSMQPALIFPHLFALPSAARNSSGSFSGSRTSDCSVCALGSPGAGDISEVRATSASFLPPSQRLCSPV